MSLRQGLPEKHPSDDGQLGQLYGFGSHMQVRTKAHRRLDGWQGSQSSRVSAIACGCLGEELAGALWDVISLFSRLIAMTGSVAVNVTLSLGSVQVADQTMFLYCL